MTRFVGAIDQGTTSSRFIVFDRGGNTIALAQREHRQIYPKPGWVEHDPLEIRDNTLAVIEEALRSADPEPADLAAVGITNQRETTLLWDRATGLPVYNAAGLAGYAGRSDGRGVCARDGGQDRFRATTGLPLASYFSALKLRWLLDNVPGVRAQGRGRRPGVRHGRQLAAVAPDRAAHHRRDQCQPDAIDGSGNAGLGRRAAGGVRRAAGGAAADRAVIRGVWTGAGAAGGGAGGGHPGRSAGGADGAGMLSVRARRRTPTAPDASC